MGLNMFTLLLRRQHFVLEDFVALGFFSITFESGFILVSRQQNLFELKKVFSFLEDIFLFWKTFRGTYIFLG